MKKNRMLIIILSLSLLLVSCKKNNLSQELPKEEDNLVSEETDEEKKVYINRVIEDVDLSSYKHIYEDELSSNEYTEFFTDNIFIDSLKFIELEYKDDNLIEIGVIEEFKEINPGEKILIHAVYPEGIPMLKIKWENNKGVNGEYIFQYNGKDGLDDSIVFMY